MEMRMEMGKKERKISIEILGQNDKEDIKRSLLCIG